MTAALEWCLSGQQDVPAEIYPPGKDPVPILQEAGWAPGSVWTSGKPRPHRDSISDRPARSPSLYRLSNPAHYNVDEKSLNDKRINIECRFKVVPFTTVTAPGSVLCTNGIFNCIVV